MVSNIIIDITIVVMIMKYGMWITYLRLLACLHTSRSWCDIFIAAFFYTYFAWCFGIFSSATATGSKCEIWQLLSMHSIASVFFLKQEFGRWHHSFIRRFLMQHARLITSSNTLRIKVFPDTITKSYAMDDTNGPATTRTAAIQLCVQSKLGMIDEQWILETNRNIIYISISWSKTCSDEAACVSVCVLERRRCSRCSLDVVLVTGFNLYIILDKYNDLHYLF